MGTSTNVDEDDKEVENEEEGNVVCTFVVFAGLVVATGEVKPLVGVGSMVWVALAVAREMEACS